MDENKLASVINVDETSIKNKAGSSETQLFKDTWINPGVKRMYHDQRLGQSKWAFWLSFFGSIAGFIVIVASLLIGLYTKKHGVDWYCRRSCNGMCFCTILCSVK